MNRAWGWRRRNMRFRRDFPHSQGLHDFFRGTARELRGWPCTCGAKPVQHAWEPGVCHGVIPKTPLHWAPPGGWDNNPAWGGSVRGV